jgi:hypothetical protein
MAPGIGNDTTTQGAPKMSSSRIRILLVSLMAVFAISAVASASASATCYKVAEPETGRFETWAKCEAGTPVIAKGAWIDVSKLETELKPGEWCALVKTAKTGNYKDNKCTAKMAEGEFIKVLVPQKRWWGCKEVAGEGKEPPTKYDEHKCNTQAKELKLRKWEWVKEAAGEKWKTVSKGGVFTLTAGTKVVTCKKVKDEGNSEELGKDEATNITFEECSTSESKCLVKSKGGTNGTVVVTSVPTQLVERGGKLADEFKENATTKEFVTLQFEKEGGGACATLPETKVKGQVAAECINLANGEIELNFPNPELPGNTLNAFGVASKLTGKVTEFWGTNEWGLQCR